ncbi:LysR family transcriptional regulator [Paraburkholderia sp. Ac-20347]|nr:LysR family transcriptional regulator [Paraburkholderia sp. Ac-20347]
MNFDDSFDPDHAPGTPAAMRALIAARLRLRHLNCIVAIAQERTLARAAARLNLSQPAVSKTLAELEQWAGARLVERGRNGAALTAAASSVSATLAAAAEEAGEAGRVEVIGSGRCRRAGSWRGAAVTSAVESAAKNAATVG